MKKKLLLACIYFLGFTSTIHANYFLENYFKSINKNITNFIYLENIFHEILHDTSTQVTQIKYGNVYPKDMPPSIQKSQKGLKYLELNEYALKNYGAPIGWERIESVRGLEGFRATIFMKSNEIVIAYIGAEVGVSDWITDGIIQSGEIAVQFEEAVDLAQKYISDYPQKNITITGYSLGGALATFSGMITNKNIITFNHLALNKKAIDFIKESIAMDGFTDKEFINRTKKIINFSFLKEFVADADNQQDADTIFGHNIIGDIFYIDDIRFNPILLDNRIFRHLLSPLKEELKFLSNPFYRMRSYDLTSNNNPINQSRASWYRDYTLDDFDILYNTSKYIVDSIPSLLEDIKLLMQNRI